MPPQKLTAIIPTLNEAENLRSCLESLSFADEILVVDSFSTDATVEIARGFPKTRLLQHEYFGNGPQCNWAMERASHPWILVVDADERATPELAREIGELLGGEPPSDWYRIRRENVFFGKVVRHAGLSAHGLVRLFRNGTARYPERRVHADVAVPGPVPALRHRLHHYTYRSFSDYVEKLQRYAEWGAADLYRAGRRSGFPAIVLHPLWRFGRMYLLQAGFLDGTAGLVVCGLQAYGTFLKYALLWEWTRMERRGEPVPLPRTAERAASEA